MVGRRSRPGTSHCMKRRCINRSEGCPMRRLPEPEIVRWTVQRPRNHLSQPKPLPWTGRSRPFRWETRASRGRERARSLASCWLSDRPAGEVHGPAGGATVVKSGPHRAVYRVKLPSATVFLKQPTETQSMRSRASELLPASRPKPRSRVATQGQATPDNDNQDRQDAAPVQRGTLGIHRKSKWDARLRRILPGVQVPYPPLSAICDRSQMAFSLMLCGRLLL
jgi:hypothetical protein